MKPARIARCVQVAAFVTVIIVALVAGTAAIAGQRTWLLCGAGFAVSVGSFAQLASTRRDGTRAPLTWRGRVGTVIISLAAVAALVTAVVKNQSVGGWLLPAVFAVGIVLTVGSTLLRDRVSRADPTVRANPEAAPPE